MKRDSPPKQNTVEYACYDRDELLAARKYIVLDDDNGLAAYHATAKAWNDARTAIAKCETS